MKTAKKRKSNTDIRQQITDKLVEKLGQNIIPWRQSWSPDPNRGHPCNFKSKRRYSGINVLITWIEQMLCGYQSRFWGSANTWSKETGGHVKKGETSTYIVFFNMIAKRDPKTKQVEKDKNGKEVKIPLMREFPIFNVEQIQAPNVADMVTRLDKGGLTRKAEALGITVRTSDTKEGIARSIHDLVQSRLNAYMALGGVELNQDPDYTPAEELIKACGAKIIHRGGDPHYVISEDKIKIPSKRTFTKISYYYETIFHELVHWTGHESRLDRLKSRDNRAFEELVAEIGACFLLSELHVPLADKMLDNSASYLQHWLKGMGDDPKYIFDASSEASKACDYLLKFIGRSNDDVSENSEE